MKDAEDEAFDELAKRQGGGFPAKQAMAADKQHWNENEWRRNNWRCGHGWLRGEQCEICIAWNAAPESAKYLRSVLDAFGPDEGISLDQKVWSKLHSAIEAVITPSTQEPPSEWAGIKAILDEYGLQAIDFVADFKAALAQPAQEPMGDEWTPCMKLPIVVHVRKQRPGEAHVSTREGITPVKPDDLIMRGVSSEEYPIGRAIFEQTYSLDTALPQRRSLTNAEFVKCIEAAGFITWDSKMWGLKRQLETFYDIGEMK